MDNAAFKTLHDICICFNEFLIKKGAIPPQLIDEYKKANQRIEEAYKKKDIKPIKAMSRDVEEMVELMDFQMAVEFKLLLKQNYGIDYKIIRRKYLKAIQKIVTRGNVISDEEYALLQNGVEEIFIEPAYVEEVVQLNRLLAEYHRKT